MVDVRLFLYTHTYKHTDEMKMKQQRNEIKMRGIVKKMCDYKMKIEYAYIYIYDQYVRINYKPWA